MCGIWFSLGFNPSPKCLDIIAHRGPDGDGWKEFSTAQGPLVMGHRRLAIIDLTENGAQPLSYQGNRYWMTYNGEIYNYKEIRDELIGKGFSFSSQSDSEVLLAAYVHWKEDCLKYLMGMFAFVIHDTQNGEIFIARDRFGIKPLYFTRTAHGFAAGSEIKQILQLDNFKAEVNETKALEYLHSGLSDHTDETMFKNIHQLQGGYFLKWNVNDKATFDQLKPIKWYQLPARPTEKIKATEAIEQYRALFIDSIRMHMRSDVRVGSCLSGGLDSSAIVGVASSLLQQQDPSGQIYTISACYEEKEVNERPFIEEVVNQWNCQPHYVYPRAEDALNLAEKITWHQDEPYGSTSIFAQWSVFEKASQTGLKVMLDGQGADEQLAGYHMAYHIYLRELFQKGHYLHLIRVVMDRTKKQGISQRSQYLSLLKSILPPPLHDMLRKMLGMTSAAAPDWLNNSMVSRLDYNGQQEKIESLDELCRKWVLSDNLSKLLHWEDRNSMAHGIEARVPFLDHRLVEYAIELGSDHKIVLGETKKILRQSMQDFIPDKIRHRHDKLGFATPEKKWFQNNLRSTVEESVEITLARFAPLFEVSEVRQLLDQTLTGQRPFDFTLWRIMNLGIWGKAFNISL